MDPPNLRAAVLLPLLLLLGAAAVVLPGVAAYVRTPCTRPARPQFQFPDCYVPDLNPNLPLSSASFVLSHDAATGYLRPGQTTPWGQVVTLYGKNQVGTAYDQLNDGARALDLRPKMLSNGTVIFHHGGVDVPVQLRRLVGDAVRWCNDNPSELVLLLPSELSYEDMDGTAYDDDGNLAAISAMAEVYSSLGVTYLTCQDVYGLTVGETMDLAALPNGGGYLLALDRHDLYGSFCGKSNWVQSKLVTCYPFGMNSTVRCTNGVNSKPLQMLREYVLESANGAATDDSGTLGPPYDLETYPFNEVQALWQVDAKSVSTGLAHLSSLLEDNRRSMLNEYVVHMVYDGELTSVSLLAVDNVALHGNALLSVLRNTCGQSDIQTCGEEISMPKMTYVHYGHVWAWMVGLGVVGLVSWRVVVVWRRRRDKAKAATLAEEGSNVSDQGLIAGVF